MNARFRFPLNRLLSIRERRERDAAISLAVARATETQLQTALNITATQRTAARDALMPPPGVTRGMAELYNMAYLLEQLDTRFETASTELQAATKTAVLRHTDLMDRVRERRMLERLRDRQLAEWRMAADRRDRDEMDTIAQGRTGNNGTSGANGAPLLSDGN